MLDSRFNFTDGLPVSLNQSEPKKSSVVTNVLLKNITKTQALWWILSVLHKQTLIGVSSLYLLQYITLSLYGKHGHKLLIWWRDALQRPEGGVLLKPQSIIKRGCWFTAISWKEVNRHMKTDLIISIWLWNEKQMGGTWLSGPLTTWCTVGDEFDERCNTAWTRNRKRTGGGVSLKICPCSSVTKVFESLTRAQI